MADPAQASAEVRAAIDREHLRLLSIGYYVMAGVTAFISCIGLFYAAMGVFISQVIAHTPTKPGQAPPPEFFRWIFAVIGGGIFSVALTAAILQFLCARRLGRRRSRTFCTVVAALSCLNLPYGTLIGVFTLMVLSPASVIALFEK